MPFEFDKNELWFCYDEVSIGLLHPVNINLTSQYLKPLWWLEDGLVFWSETYY